ncbi:MAG: hypothetical protein H6700_02350 [Myxococcales bacterium]|nr:hypothetical protein [Myxococcales bacterium]MCB9521585.1 hypothetical protein [Myxococcales bacterium]MCB9530581.1 hypothetical protein [Myxococcales bacterium]
MFGIHAVAPGLVQLTLAAPQGVGLPFGFPQNVFVLGAGSNRAVVGSGPRGARSSLLAALDAAGVRPTDVTRVVLTAALPESLGNVDVFERAAVVAAADAPLQPQAVAAAVRAELEPIARDLCRGPERHPDWDERQVDAFFDAYAAGLPAHLDVVAAPDGAELAAGDVVLELLASPGVCAHAACFVERQRGWLFTGPTMTTTPEPRLRDPRAYTDSVAQVSQLTPRLILPGTGGVERAYFHFFRSTNLAVSNLVSNMPFALHGPTAVAHVAYRDVGYWPRDVIRFAAWIWRFKVVLDELVASGVAAVEGEGAWARYTMDRPPRA